MDGSRHGETEKIATLINQSHPLMFSGPESTRNPTEASEPTELSSPINNSEPVRCVVKKKPKHAQRTIVK